MFRISQDIPELEHLFQFLSRAKLSRITAWCLRFTKSIKCTSEENTGFSIVPEPNAIMKLIQKHEFGELKFLKYGKNLNSRSKLLPLYHFLDKNCILRVRSRLWNANLSKYQKHQIILPKSQHVTGVIIKYFQENHLHSKTQLRIAAIRQKLWIFNAKKAVKRIIKWCMKCLQNVSTL